VFRLPFARCLLLMTSFKVWGS